MADTRPTLLINLAYNVILTPATLKKVQTPESLDAQRWSTTPLRRLHQTFLTRDPIVAGPWTAKQLVNCLRSRLLSSHVPSTSRNAMKFVQCTVLYIVLVY